MMSILGVTVCTKPACELQSTIGLPHFFFSINSPKQKAKATQECISNKNAYALNILHLKMAFAKNLESFANVIQMYLPI